MAKKNGKPTLLSLYKNSTKSSYEDRIKPLGSALKSNSTYKVLLGLIVSLFMLFTVQGFEIYYNQYGNVEDRSYNENFPSTEDIDYTSFDNYRYMEVPLVSLTQGLLPKLESVDTILESMPTYQNYEIWVSSQLPNYYELKVGNFFEKAMYALTKPFVQLYYNIVVRAMRIPQLIEAISVLFS